jgi:hypothetical protein
MQAAIVTLCIFSLLATGCLQVSPWRVHERPWTPELLAGAGGVRVTQSDETKIVLEDAYLDADATVLHGTRVPANGEAPVAIPTDQLTLLETKRLEGHRVIGNVGLGVLAFSLVVGVIALIALRHMSSAVAVSG